MILTLRIISVVLSLIVLLTMLTNLKKFHPIIPIMIVFDFAMVVPIFLILIMGNPTTSYKNFYLAMNNNLTVILFNLFVISAQLLFFYETIVLKKNENKSIERIKKNYFDNSTNYQCINILLIICYIIPFIVILAMLLSPDPSYYINPFTNVYVNLDAKLQSYNVHIMQNLMYILILAIGVLKWFDDDDNFVNRLIRIFYTILVILAVHKRTFMMIVIGLCLVIDIVKERNRRKIFYTYTIYILFAAIYFVYYAYATDKVSFNSDWYYVINEYFFRDVHMKFAIYAMLNPSSVHILDYPGQSILFDLFYFIPRSLWLNKPLPYVYYFISGVLGYSSFLQVNWGMPTSYFPEFVSNFGIIGIWISLIFTIWIARFLDRRGKLCKLLGTALICLLEVYYYDNSLKVLAVLVFLLYFFEKGKTKRGWKLNEKGNNKKKIKNTTRAH